MSLVMINNLVKTYDKHTAVKGVSLKIEKGEIFGLLGPNGAGKSTTINIICGLLKPTKGDVIIDGIKLSKNDLEYKSRIGLVPQEIALYDTLTAYENIEFFGKLAGLKGKFLKERIKETLDFVGLLERKNAIPKTFSGGMKRRLNIACAIVHRPKIIIMDEPTVGVDPQSRNHILESIRRLNELGSTIIYTSHYMEEIEAICNRVGIIDHGQLIALGTKEELKSMISEEEKIIIDVKDINKKSIDEIGKIREVINACYRENTLEITSKHSQGSLQEILDILSRNLIKVKGVKIVEKDLESVFLSLTGRTLRE